MLADSAHAHRDGSDTADDFFATHRWGTTGEIDGITDLKNTGGYTVVAENVYLEEEDDPTAPILPCTDGAGGIKACPATGYESLQPKFVFNGKAAESPNHSKRFGKYVLRVWFYTTHTIKVGSAGTKNYEFYNGKEGGVFEFTGAIHWAWGGTSMFVYLKDGGTAAKFNAVFKRGDTLNVRMTADWKYENNNTLSQHRN